MKGKIKLTLIGSALAGLTFGGTVFAADDDKGITDAWPPLEDGWHFTLAVPALVASFIGDIAINGFSGHVAVPASKILRSLDAAILFRGEVSLGRIGFMADFISMDLSASTETDGLVKKMDVHLGETIAEPALRWRLLESTRGWLDVYAGVRYVNIYQAADLQPNPQRITEKSTALVNEVGDRLRTALSERALRDLITHSLTDPAAGLGTGTRLPTAPIGGLVTGPIRDRIQAIIDAKKAALAEAIRDGAQQRIDAIKRELSQSIASALESRLDTHVSRVNDWWDPFVGLRGRLNLSRAWYLTGKGDFGGFTVGSQMAFEVEAAVGYQITRNLLAELGYRALDMNYTGNGLSYDVIAHGPQLTIGLRF